MSSSNIEVNDSTEGEPLERKLERVVRNGEGIDESAPPIYTERKDGIMPGYNIRTDKFDIALEAMDKIHKQDLGKRKQGIEDRKKALDELNNKNKPTGEDGKTETAQGT